MMIETNYKKITFKGKDDVTITIDYEDNELYKVTLYRHPMNIFFIYDKKKFYNLFDLLLEVKDYIERKN